MINPENLAQLGKELSSLVKLRREPVGVRFFDTIAQAEQVPGVRFVQGKMTVCQVIAQSVEMGWTVGITRDTVCLPYCATINGLRERTESFLSGKMLNGVWHSTAAAAQAHNQSLICMPQKAAFISSPLRTQKMVPEAVLVYGSPGAMFMILCGLINGAFRELSFPFLGESTCSVSWIRTILTGQPGLTTGCFAERKFGGVEDGEMVLSLSLEDLERAVIGLEALHTAGLRYPIHTYSIVSDAQQGFPAAYFKF